MIKLMMPLLICFFGSVIAYSAEKEISPKGKDVVCRFLKDKGITSRYCTSDERASCVDVCSDAYEICRRHGDSEGHCRETYNQCILYCEQ